MAVPSSNLGDLLLTDWAESALLFPEVKEPLFALEGGDRFHVETFFKVAFPCKVIRVSLSLDFQMPCDRHPRC